MKKILIRVYIVISILLFISLMILFVMGSKERIGYLGDFGIIEDQSYSNNYVYSIKINYYDKIFRHSDIYGVYLNTNSLPDYIKEIKMNDEFGTPFGTLVSKIKLEDKLDNVKYYLKIKPTIFVLITFMFIISILFIIFYNSKYLNQIMIMLLFVLFLFILFNISVSLIHILIAILSILVLLVNKKIRYFFSNNELKSRYFKIIFIFLSFLLIPGIIYTSFSFLFDKNNYENRNKSRAPYLIINNLNQYVINYESFFNDYLPFRNELVKLKNLMDLFVFRNFISDKALLGKNKWLFFKRDSKIDNTIENYIGIENFYFSDIELETIKNNLIHFRNELKKRNIDFILMICPDKEFIYTNYMPNYIKRKTDINPTDKFISYMRENTDIKIVYPKNELMKYKDKYELYYPYEHHWNALGGYIAYSELMKLFNINVKDLESLDILSFDYEYRNSSSYYSQTANYVALSDLEYFKDAKIFVISNFISKETNIMINGIFNWGLNYYYTNKYSTNTNNIYIIRDSMTQEMLDYIFPSFNEISVIPMGRFNKFDIIDKKPNIVIFETIERFLKYRLLNTLRNYRIEEINKDLETNSLGSNN